MKEGFKLDFIGIATPRGSTTWISQCLSEHPDVCVSSVKEPHFFLYDSRYNQGMPRLMKQFKHCGDKKIKGEWSNLYLYSKETALRIRKHNPDVKIIMCLRNPIERAYSQYINRKHNASIMPLYSFKYIVNHEDKYGYLSHGAYAKHIKYYQTLFPKKNIYIMFYEECVANPKKELQTLFSFLGVNPDFTPPSLNLKVHSRGKKKFYSLYLHSLINKLIFLYRESSMRYILTPLQIRPTLRFLKKINKRKTYKDFEKTPMNPLMRERLQKFYKDEISELEELVGKKLDFWK